MAEEFGRYHLLRVAGIGGMAQVHLARQIGPQGFIKPCVLKRISPDHAGDDRVRKMFLEEARISALLNHPHIVQTFDYGEVNGTPYMAMELVDGVNLSQLCRTLASKKRWLPLRACVEICIRVAEALAYAHNLTDLDGRSLRLVHRDVSPQNILLSRQGGVKLADFGIARHDARDEVTVGPSAKGKPGYMAPEQAMGQEVDARADLFAVGIVLAELISARRVLKSRHVAGLLGISKRVKELLDLRQDTPQDLKDAVIRLTAIEPPDRPQTARDAADLLRKAAVFIPGKDTLDIFLEKVFARFFPAEVIGSGSGTQASNASTFATVDPRATSTGGRADASAAPSGDPDTQIDPVIGALPSPPESNISHLEFEQNAWGVEPQPAPSGTSGVYEGWPKQFLEPDESPKLELVARSSSVDAMQFFGAQGSSRDPDAPPRDPTNPDPSVLRGVLTLPPAREKSVDPLDTRLIPKVLGAIDLAVTAPPKKSRFGPYVPLVGAGVAVAMLGLGVLALIRARAGEGAKVNEIRPGRVLVSSTPPGAMIRIDGQRTPYVTPHELTGLAVDHPVRLSVALEGHLAIPEEALVSIPRSSGRTTASFALRRGRAFQIETTPPSASVDVNGRKLSEVTPLTLPVIPFGDTASVTVALEGYIPSFLALRASTETATVSSLTLEPGKQVDIVSEPTGARVFVDNLFRGTTPLYDLLVPLERRFKVKVERRGYKTWTAKLSAKTLPARQIEANLDSLPLLAMPMSKEDLREATSYDQKANRLHGDMRRAHAALDRAEKRLSQAESSPSIFVGRIADAQRDVDDARTVLEDLEAQQQELETAVEAFRQRVMARLDGAEGDRR